MNPASRKRDAKKSMNSSRRRGSKNGINMKSRDVKTENSTDSRVYLVLIELAREVGDWMLNPLVISLH